MQISCPAHLRFLVLNDAGIIFRDVVLTKYESSTGCVSGFDKISKQDRVFLIDNQRIIKRQPTFVMISSLVLARGCRVDGDVRRGLVGRVKSRGRVAGAGSGVGVGVSGAANHLSEENACYITFREL